ncbi:MAG TPA: hypothetical protein VJC17_00060, partial [Candidatus Dojkabacteria bacterium]|nr:hypothetical protein [Candidatus Dojkabacteria bacterium]
LTKESGPVISKDFSAKLQELDTEMALKKGKQGKTMESYVAEVQSSQEKSSEVEVVVEPISKLSGLNFGKGKGKDPAFGLVHHVLQAQDYDNLTGDEILVVPELLPDYLDKINTVKGLVVEKDVAEDLLEKVQVPLVYNLNKSTENMQENMVVTLDPESAQVLAGAGKKAAPDTEKVPETAKPGKEPESNIVFDIVGEAIPVVRSKIASKAEKGNAKPAGGQTKEMAGKPAAESAVSLGPAVPGAGAALTDLPDVQPAKEVKNEKEHKEPESKEKPETPVEPEAAAEKEIPETKKQNNGEVLQKTVTEFWQFLEVVGPEINPPNIDGVFVQIQSFYDVLKVNPDDLIKRKEQRQDFISKVLEQLKEILAKLQGKPLVLQGITKNPAAGNGDNDEFMEKVNVDLAIIDRIRNRESYRNVWYALGGVNNAREQSELKKIITSYGLRRSSTFKIYTTLATPIAAISVKSLLENEIDAVILDLDKLLEAFAIGSLDEGFSDFLTWLIRTVNTNKNNALLLIKEVTVSKDQVAALLNAGLHGFIMHYDDFKHMKQVVSSLEVKRVVKEKSKRGRRPKKLDYGF